MIVEKQVVPFLILIAFWAVTLYWGWKSTQGEPPRLRRLPQVDAIDEAVGRAAEMGRPCYHFPGQYSTAQKAWLTVAIAGLNCMRHVAKKCADLGVPFVVGSITLDLIPHMNDMVRSAYVEAGRLDDFDQETQVRYLGAAARAAIPAMIARGKPAYVSQIGSYSLDFIYGAETAKKIGAMVISGDARMSQIATMAVTSDYFLCGEEIYAASAIVSKEPVAIGNIVGQDWSELLFIIITLLAFIAVNVGFEEAVLALLAR